MLELTKFLGLHNEFFGQEIPIRNDALTRIRITFHGNLLSAPGVISFVINGASSLDCTPFESVFTILVIALISSSMRPSMKI
jgi:hypothetical protein